MLPAVLAACGFEPVYAPGSAASQLQGRVLVNAPEDAETYLLVQDLEQRLGRSTAPDFGLNVSLLTETEGQAVTATGEITRFSIVGVAQYELRDLATDSVITEGSVENFTGYSATGSTVETLAAERDATARLMTILADQITTVLYATAEIPG